MIIAFTWTSRSLCPSFLLIGEIQPIPRRPDREAASVVLIAWKRENSIAHKTVEGIETGVVTTTTCSTRKIGQRTATEMAVIETTDDIALEVAAAVQSNVMDTETTAEMIVDAMTGIVTSGREIEVVIDTATTATLAGAEMCLHLTGGCRRQTSR